MNRAEKLINLFAHVLGEVNALPQEKPAEIRRCFVQFFYLLLFGWRFSQLHRGGEPIRSTQEND